MVVVLLAMPGCGPPEDCVARGDTSSFTGSVTYTGQTQASGQSTSLTGSFPETLTVYDLTSACTYDEEEIALAVGSCQLWALVGIADAGGGTATIEPNQPCTLDVATGTVVMAVMSGLLTEGANAELTLAGTITIADDGGSSQGYLQWTFLAQ